MSALTDTKTDTKAAPKVDPKKQQLDEIHATLKTIAERGTMAGERTLAACMMRLIEHMRGEAPKTELPKQHHA